MFDSDLEAKIEPLLLEDEKLLWLGKAWHGASHIEFLLRRYQLQIFMAVVPEIIALLIGAYSFAGFWAFVQAVGLLLHAIVIAIKPPPAARPDTVYAVTKERIILGYSEAPRFYVLSSLPDIQVKAHHNGTGTITFGFPNVRGRRTSIYVPSFVRVNHAADVAKLIRNTQRDYRYGRQSIIS